VGRACAGFTRRSLAALLALGLVLVISACGLNVQTNKPYTPADGVNLDAGSVKIRNLMILSRAAGEGFVSASLTSDSRDALTGVSGNPIKADGTEGAAFTATVSNPVALGNGVLAILTERPLITVKSADLRPGLTAKLVLQFTTAGEVTVLVPVVDANVPAYATISPSPTPSA
jgi:hypothetical protein